MADAPVKERASAREVRAWALGKGLTVGARGHLPTGVVAAFNKAHRKREFVSSNPWQAKAS